MEATRIGGSLDGLKYAEWDTDVRVNSWEMPSDIGYDRKLVEVRRLLFREFNEEIARYYERKPSIEPCLEDYPVWQARLALKNELKESLRMSHSVADNVEK
jgi:hypothetical protein